MLLAKDFLLWTSLINIRASVLLLSICLLFCFFFQLFLNYSRLLPVSDRHMLPWRKNQEGLALGPPL